MIFTNRVVGFPVHAVFSVYVILSAENYVFPPPGPFSGCDLAPGDTQHLVGIFFFCSNGWNFSVSMFFLVRSPGRGLLAFWHALLLAHCWPCASFGPLLALRFFWPTAGLALLLAHCWPCASSGLLAYWPFTGLLRVFFGLASGLLWTALFLQSLGLAALWPSSGSWVPP